jgi:hypothetical protein
MGASPLLPGGFCGRPSSGAARVWSKITDPQHSSHSLPRHLLVPSRGGAVAASDGRRGAALRRYRAGMMLLFTWNRLSGS